MSVVEDITISDSEDDDLLVPLSETPWTDHIESSNVIPNTNPNVCNICGRIFAKAHRVKLHIKEVHHPNYVNCQICGKLVKDLRLNEHIRKVHLQTVSTKKTSSHHSDENEDLMGSESSRVKRSSSNKNRCHLCGKKFDRPYRVKVHINEVHFPNFVNCHICGKSVKDLRLNEHVRNAHWGATKERDPLENAEIEDESLVETSKSPNSSHVENSSVKVHKCDICGREFEKSYRLKTHIGEVHHPNYVECHICGKSVKDLRLNEHLRNVHSQTTTKKNVQKTKV